MSRRGYRNTLHCSHPGCAETSSTVYDTRKDEARGYEYRRTWKCIQHMAGEAHMTPANARRELTLTVYEEPFGKFWAPIQNGFAHGPGFQAFAKDFPVGATLVVTATLAMPEEKP